MDTSRLIQSGDRILKHCFSSAGLTLPIKISPIDSGLDSQTFLVATNHKKLILKLFAPQKYCDLEYENSIIKALNLVSKNYIFLASEIFTMGNQIAMLYEYIEGKSLQITNVTQENIVEISTIQAKMHKILEGFKYNENSRQRFSIFDYNFVEKFETNSANTEANLINEAKTKMVELLEPFRESTLPYSIIHEDLELVNILINTKNQFHFIDFGEAHKAPIISDIATALKEIIINTHGLDYQLIKTYLHAYQKKYPVLDQNQLNMISGLLLRRTLFMFTYLLHKGKILGDKKNHGYSCNIDVEKKVLELLLNANKIDFNCNEITKND
jgi:Ser/Thr protein kinase RdoA (MazF antagonist)